MEHIPSMVDMKRTPAEAQGAQDAIMAPCEYPYGLCISFTNDELDKLNLDDEVQVGDMIHMHCLARVTSVSSHDHEKTGSSRRIELQITHISADSEDEDSENREEEAKEKPAMKRRTPRLYE